MEGWYLEISSQEMRLGYGVAVVMVESDVELVWFLHKEVCD